MMVSGGIWCVLPFLQFFFSDVSHIANPDRFTSYWELTLLLAATPFGLVGGWLSDRYGRKIFVYASGACQSLAVVLFIIFFPSQLFLLFGIGILFGVGYGLYYAVDWALACDTLPDKKHAAKDMGLFHVAYTFPQIVLPSALGFVLDAFNRNSANSGFRVVFAVRDRFLLARDHPGQPDQVGSLKRSEATPRTAPPRPSQPHDAQFLLVPRLGSSPLVEASICDAYGQARQSRLICQPGPLEQRWKDVKCSSGASVGRLQHMVRGLWEKCKGTPENEFGVRWKTPWISNDPNQLRPVQTKPCGSTRPDRRRSGPG